MKIALVSPYDYPYPGGVVKHIFYLDREFRRLGHVRSPDERRQGWRVHARRVGRRRQFL